MEFKPTKVVQTSMLTEEVEELEEHIRKLRKSGIDTSKTQFVREVILKEVRKDHDKSLPLHK